VALIILRRGFKLRYKVVEAMSSKVILMMPKNQELNKFQRFKNPVSRVKNQDQDSRLKIQETREDSIKISSKMFFKTLSSTRSFHKIITKEFYSLVIDYQKVVIDY